MKRLINYQLLFVLSLITVLSYTGMAQNFEWAQFLTAVDGSNNQNLVDMAKDDEGNVYALGMYETNSVIETDTIKAHTAERHSCYISKFSPLGKLLWIQPFGTKSFDFAENIAVTGDHVFVSVFMQGDTVFYAGGSFPKAAARDGIIVKFNTNGEYVDYTNLLDRLRIDDIEVVDTMLYVACGAEIKKLNFDLERVGGFKFDARQYVQVDDMQNVNDTSVLITGTFGIDIGYQDTLLNPVFSGEGSKAFLTSINVEKDSMHWIHVFGKVRVGLRLAYSDGNQFYLAGNYSSDFELAGHINPLTKFSGAHGFVAAGLLDGTITKTGNLNPTKESGYQDVNVLIAEGPNVFVAGSVTHGDIKYNDGDTVSFAGEDAWAYFIKLDRDINYQYGDGIGSLSRLSASIEAGVATGNQFFFGGRVIGNTAKIGCDVYDVGGQFVFLVEDSAPDDTPEISFRFNRSSTGEVRFISRLRNHDYHYWDFGDNSDVDSLAINPMHLYHRKGAIEVKLHAGNKCGETVYTQTIKIKGIGSMNPIVSGNTNLYIGKITGVGFTPNATFRLITAGGKEKEIRQVNYLDSTSFNIMVEFNNDPLDVYDLYMEDGERKDTLRNTLYLKEVEEAKISCEFFGSTQVLKDRKYGYLLKVKNLGNNTAYGVPVTIVGPRGSNIIVDRGSLIRNEVVDEWTEKMGGNFLEMDPGNPYNLVTLGSFIIPAIEGNHEVNFRVAMKATADGIAAITAFYDPPMFSPTDLFLDPDAIALDSLICPDSPVINALLAIFGIDEDEAGFNLSSMGCVMYSLLLDYFGGGSFQGTGFGGGNSTSTFVGNTNNALYNQPVNLAPIVLASAAAANPELSDEELIDGYGSVTETLPGTISDSKPNGNGNQDPDPVNIPYPTDIICLGECSLKITVIKDSDLDCPNLPGCLLPLIPFLEPLIPDPEEMPFNPDDEYQTYLKGVNYNARDRDPSFFEWLYETAFKVNVRASKDPNEKYGLLGYGEENYIKKNRTLNYHITFENADTATAPASEVFVYDTLDLSVTDTTNFSWNMIGWGDFSMVIEQKGTHVIEYIDMRPHGGNIIVQFEGKVDSMGVLSAVYTSLDTGTWALTNNLFDGFLPPNVSAPEGEGFFNYSIGQKPDLPTGSRIENKATIIFDRNESITTGIALNTIDDEAPVSSVKPFASEFQYDSLVRVEFQGIDNESGLKGYNVFIKQNSGSFALYARDYKEDHMNILANYGDTLSFFVSASDNVGNYEKKELTTQARIRVVQNITGIEDEMNADQIVLFPNPSTGEMNIKSEMGEVLYSYRIIDLAGKTIENHKLNQMSQSSIRIDQLQTGVYIMDLETSAGTVRKKIIKN